jgi:hypothetical protein
MKKTLLVCSDIFGTYSALNTRKQIEMLKNIDEMKTKLELDQVVFCFVSTSSCKEIEEVVNNSLLPVLEETKLEIEVGPHLGIDGYSYNGSKPKLFVKDIAKGVQMANLVDLFETIIPQSEVSHFIYVDDHPNINPILFLTHIKNDKNELKEVFFLVKKDEFNGFIKTNNYSFDIKTIEKREDDFLLEGLIEINNSINNRKKTR